MIFIDLIALGLTLPWLCISAHEDLLSGGVGPVILVAIQVWIMTLKSTSTKVTFLDVFMISTGGWFLMAGFHPLTALLGMGVLGRSRLNLSRWAILMLSLFPILVPLGWLEWTQFSRQMSLTLLDGLLYVIPGAERTGVSLFFRGEQLVVLSSCSGATLTRLLLVISGLIVLSQGKGFWKIPLAIPLGLTINALRIFLGLILLPLVGENSFSFWDQALGILLLGGAAFFLMGKSNWNFQVPFNSRMCLPLVFACTIPFLTPGSLAEDVQHLQWDGNVTIHRFTEERTGINRFLLDHPLEACLSARGYDLDAIRSQENKIGKVKAVKVIYRIGDITCGERSKTLLHLLSHPGSWNEPLEVEVWIWG